MARGATQRNTHPPAREAALCVDVAVTQGEKGNVSHSVHPVWRQGRCKMTSGNSSIILCYSTKARPLRNLRNSAGTRSK